MFDALNPHRKSTQREDALRNPQNWPADDEIIEKSAAPEPVDPSPSPEDQAIENIDAEREAKKELGEAEE